MIVCMGMVNLVVVSYDLLFGNQNKLTIFHEDVCGNAGRGTAYHCDKCSFDAHLECVVDGRRATTSRAPPTPSLGRGSSVKSVNVFCGDLVDIVRFNFSD